MPDNAGVPSEVEDRPKKSTLREIVESLVIAVVLALLIRTFILQPFYIPSGSMEPNLMIQDHIIVNKIGYRFWEPQRGDIVVFKFPRDPSKDFVKRLIGQPGDKVEIRKSKLYINGNLVSENYLPAGLEFGSFGPAVIPENSYFMMGDNRNNSDDSRSWGVLPRENIIGKAVLTYWPLNRIHLLTGSQE
ncbi:MAG: signal peptidase I [Peptococcaceae bacterium BICA1-7]|nr:MAG: signal peptidase I [Peptococcaceae bacterium BICA1-7]HBV98922.1 signal peptidase I [Desulfotomaculum sp.]